MGEIDPAHRLTDFMVNGLSDAEFQAEFVAAVQAAAEALRAVEKAFDDPDELLDASTTFAGCAATVHVIAIGACRRIHRDDEVPVTGDADE